MNDDKKSINTNSSAERVEQYLQALDSNSDAREKLYYSQEQTFSADELAQVINEQRLNELLAQSDDFLSELNSEIKDFDEGPDKDNN